MVQPWPLLMDRLANRHVHFSAKIPSFNQPTATHREEATLTHTMASEIVNARVYHLIDR